MTFFLAVSLCLLQAAGMATEPSMGDLQAAGSGEHAWFMLPGDADEPAWDLCHSGSRSTGNDYRVVRRFEEAPLAMAAADDTLWLVFEGGSKASPRLDVYRLQANFHSSLDLYAMQPRDGLDVLPPLHGVESLVQFVGTRHGPVCIGSVPGESRTLTMQRLQGGRWTSMELPKDLEHVSHVLAAGSDHGFMMIAPSGEHTIATWHETGGTWVGGHIPEAMSSQSLLEVDGQPLVVSGTVGKSIELAYIRSDALWPLVEVAVPTEDWALVSQRGQVLLLTVLDGTIDVTSIDAITGKLDSRGSLEPVSSLSSGLWSIAIALGLASMVVMVIILARGGDLASMKVPEGWTVLRPMPRLLALIVDLVPGLLSFFLVAGGTMQQLVRVPLMSLPTSDLGPYLVLVMVTLAWCFLCERSTGTTPGKRIMGAAVRTCSGERPGTRAVLVRNIMKGLVLLVPPLVVLALLHPYQQGIGDLMARTIVVRSPGGSRGGQGPPG